MDVTVLRVVTAHYQPLLYEFSSQHGINMSLCCTVLLVNAEI